MSRKHFQVALLCQLLLLLLHLTLVRQGAVPDSPLFREFQGFVWRTIPRWRIFVGLHALVLAVAASAVGFALLACFRPAGRWLFALGLLAYLAYLRLEPRFFPADWGFIFAIAAAELGGLFTLLVVAGREGRRNAVLLALPSVLFSFALFRFARGIAIGAAPSVIELSSFVVFFSAGYLLALSLWGSVAEYFAMPRAEISYPTRRMQRGLMLNVGTGLLLSLALLSRSDIGWPALAVPFAPFVVAFYATYSWFVAAGDTVVFSSQLSPDTAGLDLALRNRLLLGILFQYFCVTVVAALFGALRADRSRTAVLAAHLMLLLYWIPVLWLCQMLILYPAQ